MFPTLLDTKNTNKAQKNFKTTKDRMTHFNISATRGSKMKMKYFIIQPLRN